jgi:hypothetical protein
MTPHLLRPVAGKLIVKVPYQRGDPAGNREMLRGILPERAQIGAYDYGNRAYRIGRGQLGRLLVGLLDHYIEVEVSIFGRSSERCAEACWTAQGSECDCSCAGAYHGIRLAPGRIVASSPVVGDIANVPGGQRRWDWVATKTLSP